MTLESVVCKLEAYLQEEKGVQGRLLGLLEAQEKAVRAGDTQALEITGVELEAVLSGEPARDRRRCELVASIASSLGVPARIVSVGSLVERLGPKGERLGRLREELRDTLLEVRVEARKIAHIARGHQEVLRDVLRVIVGDVGESGGSGMLVNAKG